MVVPQKQQQTVAVGHCPPSTGVIATCATPNLYLKYPNETIATYFLNI
jgi:hypothetical protein